MSDDVIDVLRDNYTDLHCLMDCHYTMYGALASMATAYDELKKGTPKLKTGLNAIFLGQMEHFQKVDEKLKTLIDHQLLLLETEQRKYIREIIEKPKAVVKEIKDV